MTIEIVMVLVGAALFAVGGRWRATGWMPKTLYLVGGALLAAFALRHASALVVLGVGAMALSRIVPARGWHKQPGEG